MFRLPIHAACLAFAVAFSSLALSGEAEPPGLTPEVLAARLAKLTGDQLELVGREKDLLADAKQGKLSRVSLAEAALLASGVRDEVARKKYLDRIDALEKEARRATADVQAPYEKGARLLQWLHAGPMTDYSKDQDHLPALLDEGKYNCVSSTVLYNVLGQRLGLELRGVLTWAHIFSVQYDGVASKDVETTRRNGHDLSNKTPNRREVRDFGVLAAVFRNTASRMARQDRHPEAIRAALFAQTLDPSERPTRDLENAFRNWCVSHVKRERFSDALAVVALGLEVLPGNAKVTGDRGYVYGSWARSHRGKGEWATGATLLIEAVSAHRGDRGIFQAAEVHYLLWAQSDSAKAAEVLQEGLHALPKSLRLKNELARIKKKQAK